MVNTLPPQSWTGLRAMSQVAIFCAWLAMGRSSGKPSAAAPEGNVAFVSRMTWPMTTSPARPRPRLLRGHHAPCAHWPGPQAQLLSAGLGDPWCPATWSLVQKALPRSPQPCDTSTQLPSAHSSLPYSAAPWTSHDRTRERPSGHPGKRAPSHSGIRIKELALKPSESHIHRLLRTPWAWTGRYVVDTRTSLCPLGLALPCLGVWKAMPASNLPPSLHGQSEVTRASSSLFANPLVWKPGDGGLRVWAGL